MKLPRRRFLHLVASLAADSAFAHATSEWRQRVAIPHLYKRGLVALLESMAPLNEPFPKVDDPVPPPEQIF
jgi:hypothetical protein